MRIFTDLSNDVLRAFQENVSDDDLCSFAREPFGGGAPNATPPPGDTGYPSSHPLHPRIPPLLDPSFSPSPSRAAGSTFYFFTYHYSLFLSSEHPKSTRLTRRYHWYPHYHTSLYPKQP